MRLSTRLTMALACLCPAVCPATESTLTAFDVTVFTQKQGVYWGVNESALCRSETGEFFVRVATYPETPHSVVAFPKGLVVGVGTQIYLRSDQGGSEKPVADLGEAATNVAWYPLASRLAAWAGSRVWISDLSGETWASAVVGADPSTTLSGLAFQGERWLAYGTVTASGSDDAQPRISVWSSPDGRQWSASALPKLADGVSFKAVVSKPRQTVLAAVEDQGEVDGVPQVFLRLWSTADGRNWSSIEAPTGIEKPWNADLASGPAGIFLADGPRLWRLSESNTWKPLPTLSSEAGRFLSSNGSTYWLISDVVARQSKDGITWAEHELQPGWWFRQLGLESADNDDPIVYANRRDSNERSFGPLSSFLLK